MAYRWWLIVTEAWKYACGDAEQVLAILRIVDFSVILYEFYRNKDAHPKLIWL